MKNTLLRNTVAFALIGSMAMTTFACSNSGSEDPVNIGSGQTTIVVTANTEGSAADTTADSTGSYGFSYSGARIVVNTDIKSALEKLGEPSKYRESESCAYQGLDKVYTFPFFVIYTYPSGGCDMISSIDIKADTVVTDEGIMIGSSKKDVIAKYGDSYDEQGSVIKYKKGECVLSFAFTDDVVSGIVYDYADLKTA